MPGLPPFSAAQRSLARMLISASMFGVGSVGTGFREDFIHKHLYDEQAFVYGDLCMRAEHP